MIKEQRRRAIHDPVVRRNALHKSCLQRMEVLVATKNRYQIVNRSRELPRNWRMFLASYTRMNIASDAVAVNLLKVSLESVFTKAPRERTMVDSVAALHHLLNEAHELLLIPLRSQRRDQKLRSEYMLTQAECSDMSITMPGRSSACSIACCRSSAARRSSCDAYSCSSDFRKSSTSSRFEKSQKFVANTTENNMRRLARIAPVWRR
jgi:hypothetical protein